jgi:hypothetical protein
MRRLGVSLRTELRRLWHETGGRERIIDVITTLFPDRKRRGNRPMLNGIDGSMIAAAVSEIIRRTGKSITSKEVREMLRERITSQGQQELKDAQARGDTAAMKRALRKIKAKVSKNFMANNKEAFLAYDQNELEQQDLQGAQQLVLLSRSHHSLADLSAAPAPCYHLYGIEKLINSSPLTTFRLHDNSNSKSSISISNSGSSNSYSISSSVSGLNKRKFEELMLSHNDDENQQHTSEEDEGEEKVEEEDDVSASTASS